MDVKSVARTVFAGLAVLGCATSLSAAPQAAPDLTGSWERFGGLGARGGAQRDPRIPPPAPAPPLKPDYLKQWRERQQQNREAEAKGQPIATHWVACLPDGMPGMMSGPFPIEILQTKGQVTVIQESFTQIRRILLDRPQKPLDELDPTFYGNSVGRWEGDTLVAETIGIKEYVQYQNVPHSPQMKLRERFHLAAPDILWDEITIEDPVTLEKPWTFTFAYRRMPDYTLLEYICEDNREYADEQGRQKTHLTDPGR